MQPRPPRERSNQRFFTLRTLLPAYVEKRWSAKRTQVVPKVLLGFNANWVSKNNHARKHGAIS